MDRLYNCDNESYNFVGRKINLRKYFDEFSSKLRTDEESVHELLKTRGIELTEEQMINLEEDCE